MNVKTFFYVISSLEILLIKSMVFHAVFHAAVRR